MKNSPIFLSIHDQFHSMVKAADFLDGSGKNVHLKPWHQTHENDGYRRSLIR